MCVCEYHAPQQNLEKETEGRRRKKTVERIFLSLEPECSFTLQSKTKGSLGIRMFKYKQIKMSRFIIHERGNFNDQCTYGSTIVSKCKAIPSENTLQSSPNW